MVMAMSTTLRLRHPSLPVHVKMHSIEESSVNMRQSQRSLCSVPPMLSATPHALFISEAIAARRSVGLITPPIVGSGPTGRRRHGKRAVEIARRGGNGPCCEHDTRQQLKSIGPQEYEQVREYRALPEGPDAQPR